MAARTPLLRSLVLLLSGSVAYQKAALLPRLRPFHVGGGDVLLYGAGSIDPGNSHRVFRQAAANFEGGSRCSDYCVDSGLDTLFAVRGAQEFPRCGLPAFTKDHTCAGGLGKPVSNSPRREYLYAGGGADRYIEESRV